MATTADPLGNAANSINNTTSGAIGTIKNTFHSASRIASPILKTSAILSTSALLGGGVSALAGATGPLGFTDMIKVPAEGFTELTSSVSNIASWLSAGAAPYAAPS